MDVATYNRRERIFRDQKVKKVEIENLKPSGSFFFLIPAEFIFWPHLGMTTYILSLQSYQKRSRELDILYVLRNKM